jgi:hypothetical protein
MDLTELETLAPQPPRRTGLDGMLRGELADRRLVGRVLAYWHERCGERRMPRFADIDAEALGHDWRWSIVLDVTRGAEAPEIIYFGRELLRVWKMVSAGPGNAAMVLDRAQAQLRLAVSTCRPALFDGDMPLGSGSRALFRSVLLPLSDDDERVECIIGAANGTIFDHVK